MDKINQGSTIPAYPMPVSLVGTHVNGKPNFLAAAWFTMAGYKPPLISIALGKGHYSNSGIKDNYKQKLLQNLIIPDIFSDPQDIGLKDHLWMDTTLKILP